MCYQVKQNIYGNRKSLNLSLIDLAYRYKPTETQIIIFHGNCIILCSFVVCRKRNISAGKSHDHGRRRRRDSWKVLGLPIIWMGQRIRTNNNHVIHRLAYRFAVRRCVILHVYNTVESRNVIGREQLVSINNLMSFPGSNICQSNFGWFVRFLVPKTRSASCEQ